MKRPAFYLLALAMLAYASTRSRGASRLTALQSLKGWQKVLGLAAFVLALLILLNPEFLALGLLGDTAFFDLLVLALILQMHTFAISFYRRSLVALSTTARWLRVPSPGLLYLLAVCAAVPTTAVNAWQKLVHRIF